jgi:hypothetical protein
MGKATWNLIGGRSTNYEKIGYTYTIYIHPYILKSKEREIERCIFNK